jgi:hypothetical protein
MSASKPVGPSLQELRAARGGRPSRPPRFRGFILIGGFFGAVVLFGFFGLPGIVKTQTIQWLTARLGRTVTIEKIQINPFTFSATIEGFAVAEAAVRGGEFISWRSAHLNLAPWPLLIGKVHLQELSIDGFRARVAKSKDGGHNFDDIITRHLTVSSSGLSGLWIGFRTKATPFSLVRLTVTDARLELADTSLERPYASVAGPVSFTLENFHTVGDAVSI